MPDNLIDLDGQLLDIDGNLTDDLDCCCIEIPPPDPPLNPSCECLFEEGGEVRRQVGARITLTLNTTPETYTDAFGFGCTATSCPNIDGVYDVGCECTEVVSACKLLCTYSSFGQTKYVWGQIKATLTLDRQTRDGDPCAMVATVLIEAGVRIINDDPTSPGCEGGYTVLRNKQYQYVIKPGTTGEYCTCIEPGTTFPFDNYLSTLDTTGACNFAPDITVVAISVADCPSISLSSSTIIEQKEEDNARKDICKGCKFYSSKGCSLYLNPCTVKQLWADQIDPPSQCPYKDKFSD